MLGTGTEWRRLVGVGVVVNLAVSAEREVSVLRVRTASTSYYLRTRRGVLR